MTRRDVLLKRELKREMGSTEPLLEEEIERLNNIVNRAIEYIENPRHEMSVKSYQELLEILKEVSE